MTNDDTNKPPGLEAALASDVKDTKEAVIRMEESVKSMWHVIRDDVKPDVKELPGKITEAISRHSTECPARTVFLQKAAAPSNAPGPPSGNGLSFPRVPMRLIYFCVGLGVVITTVILSLKYFEIF